MFIEVSVSFGVLFVSGSVLNNAGGDGTKRSSLSEQLDEELLVTDLTPLKANSCMHGSEGT